jgi:hypothetical protein
MKRYSPLLVLLFATMVFATSCKKEATQARPNAERTIKFSLYTERDFSSDNDNITFSLFIKNHSNTIFDSALATMRVKDIPNLANKLVFIKSVSGDGSELAAGFNYSIENVGMSWYIDTCGAQELFKEINFSFK